MRKLAFTLALLWAGAAFGQSAVLQDGTVTRNHLSKWSQDHRVKDVGGLTGDGQGVGASPFSISDSLGLGVCLNSATTTGNYNAFCLGHDSSGNALLTVDSYGGATGAAYLRQNGTTYPLTSSGGNITGPTPAVTAGHLTMFNGGNTIADAMANNVSCPSGVLGCLAVPGMSMPSGLGFQRTTAAGSNANDFLFARNANYSGGTHGFVNTALNVATHVNAGVTAYEWNALFQMANYSTIADLGENVAMFVQSQRFSTGSTWASVFQLIDKGVAAAGTASFTVEMDKNAWDDDPHHASAILDLVGYTTDGSGGPWVISYGLLITGASPAPTFWKAIYLSSSAPMTYGIYSDAVGTASNGIVQASTAFIQDRGSWGVGLDLHAGTYATAGIWLPDTTNLFFNSAGTASLFWNTSSSCVNLASSGVVKQSLCVNGRFGIGASAPATTLDVAAGSGTQARVYDGTVDMRLVPGSSLASFGSYSAHDVVLLANSTEQIRLLSAGGVKMPNLTGGAATKFVCADASNVLVYKNTACQ